MRRILRRIDARDVNITTIDAMTQDQDLG